MADGEGSGDGPSITPFNSEQQGNARNASFTMSPTDATPENAAPEAIMKAALISGPPPKKNQPPTILPIVELQRDDVLVKGKGLQGGEFSSSILEESIRRVSGFDHIVPLTIHRVGYLGTYRDSQHQLKNEEYFQMIEKFIMKHENSSLDEILSKEMDPGFLRQLLEDILDSQAFSLDADADKGGASPDPVLATLTSAPSFHRRANARELLAPIAYQ